MGNSSTASVRGFRRYRSVRGRGLWLIALTVLSFAALPAVAAQADALWAGANASPEWSQPTNWNASSTTPPTTNGTAAGTITFPDLGSTSTCTTTCYTSHNGLTGISATGLVFSNTTSGTQYRVLGNAFSLGTGGITENSGGGTGDVINTPLALTGSQFWTIGMGPDAAFNSLSVVGGVTGSNTLGVTFPASSGAAPTGALFVNGDVEVGAVSVTGDGGLHVGGSGIPGSVNGTDGSGVSLSGNATLVANPNAKVGALSLVSSKLQLGTAAGNTGTPATLSVNGAASLDSASTTSALINDNGSTARDRFLAAQRHRQHRAQRRPEALPGPGQRWMRRAQQGRRCDPVHDDRDTVGHFHRCAEWDDPDGGELVPGHRSSGADQLHEQQRDRDRGQWLDADDDHAGDAEPVIGEHQPEGHADGDRDDEHQRQRRPVGDGRVLGQRRADRGLHEPAGQRQRIDRDGDVHDVICRRQLARVADGGVHRLKRFRTDRLDQHPAVADRQQGSDRHQARGVQSESGCGRRRDLHGHGDPECDRREHALGHGRVHGQRQPDLELPSSAADDRVVDGDVRGLLLGRRGAFDHRRLWRRRQLLGLDLSRPPR